MKFIPTYLMLFVAVIKEVSSSIIFSSSLLYTGGAKVGLQLCVGETEFILIFLFINYCIIFI